MQNEKEIPCAKCKSYRAREKKFFCIPDDCAVLTAWIRKYAPQLNQKTIQAQAQVPEIAIQYIV